MLRSLGLEEEMKHARISEYETGQREPSLLTLPAYSRAAGIHMEVLADDETDSPAGLPAKPKHKS